MIGKTRTMRWPVIAVNRFALSRDLRGIGSVLMKKWFILIACLWGFQASAQQTYTAKSCNLSDVSAAIAAEQAHPVDGDIISIPAGSCTWTGTQHLSPITFNNSVTIQGAGAISATTGGASTAGTDQTVITDNASYSGFSSLMMFGTTAGKSFRFTGIAVLTNGSSVVTNNGIIALSGSSTSVRVDHCHFSAIASTLAVNGSVLGVADHNFVESRPGSLTTPIYIQNGVGWNGVSDPNGYGDSSWADSEHWGTSQFFFVEDSQFLNGGLGDAHDGARYVLRHNTVQQTITGNCPPPPGQNSSCSSGQMYNHGMSNSPGNGTRAAEVYSNNFVQPVAAGGPGGGGPAYSVNSGTLLFWGNTVAQYLQAVNVGYTCRPDSNGCNYAYTNPPNGWGHCGTAFGPSAWDQNSNSSGYPCLSQPGRGKGDLLNGQNFPNRLNTRTGTVAWPQQALSPIYVWANTYAPSAGYSGATLVGNTIGSLFSDNVDYYQQFGAGAEPGSFNGAKGVGQGLLSARPSTCAAGPGGNTPGVGYWATDTNTLYVCNPTNTWTVYYTPYTYPHPLTQSSLGTGVAAPTGLAATVQ